MNNVNQIIEDLGDEFLEDFAANIYAEVAAVEEHTMSIHVASDSNQRIDKILHAIENIKRHCRLAFLDPLLAYVESLHDIINHVYIDHVQDHEILSELLLLMFDQIRAACEEVSKKRHLNVPLLDDFRENMISLCNVPPSRLDESAREMINRFAHTVHPDLIFKVSETLSVEDHLEILRKDPEVGIFESLAQSIDGRSEYTADKSQAILQVALAINTCLTHDIQVDSKQLAVAVYMHDIAMAFLPDALLFKKAKFDADELMLLEQHPIQAFSLMSLMPRWLDAAEMVRQHHERYDGKGYPNGLCADEICWGAKIIAVADTYCAITKSRADRLYHKSSLRALTEINSLGGAQFDPIIISGLIAALKDGE